MRTSTSCPSQPHRKSKYYGISETIGAGGLGRATWPPKPPTVRMNQINKPSDLIGFVDGHPTKDSWVSRPLVYPMGGTFASSGRLGWERHDQHPNMVHMDGHATNRPYEELDIYSWSDQSTKFWRLK